MELEYEYEDRTTSRYNLLHIIIPLDRKRLFIVHCDVGVHWDSAFHVDVYF